MLITIKDFLSKSTAEDIYQAVQNYPHEWLTRAVKALDQPVEYVYDNRDSTGDLKQSLHSDLFTYHFHRSTEHVETCTCVECSFNENVLQGPMIDVVKEHAGLQDPYVFERFLSKYYPGDFLSEHKDHGRGVAFIYHLTKDWRPEYGGLLHIKQPDGSYKVVVPEFNTMVIMDLGTGGHDHFVSEVSQYAPTSRNAISGWYNDRANENES